MAKKNSTAPKKAMIFNSVLLITAENVVSFVKSLPKTIMTEDSFNSYMERNFYFGGKFHGNDFNSGSHYSTIVRQLGLYHILNGKFVPRFTNDIDVDTADKYLKYWLKLYIAPNPTSQPSLKNSIVTPKFVLKEIISFLESNPNVTNIYEIVDKIFQQELSRNDKGNLANILNRFSDSVKVDNNYNASLTVNYKNVMEDINALINDPNRFFEHFGKGVRKNQKRVFNLQKIYYGAPGTGKSHEIKEQTEGEAVVRTTFHPDSDYSTFVGAYKPVMDNEKRITYQFVKQAFLKAYLGAWKKYVDGCSIGSACSTPVVHEFNTGNGSYVINSVGMYDLTLSREFHFSKSLVQKEWPNLWNNGVFNVPKGPQSGKSVQHAIANWIFDKIDACTEAKFDEGWKKLVETVKEKKHVDVQKSQTYIICGVADDNETLTINVEARCKKKDTLKRKFYELDEKKLSKLEKALVDILKGYSSDFEDAWEFLKQNVNEGVTPEVKDETDGQIDPQFLVIEEINRGNCAQIFGDIFQLLDRGDNGFSIYPIEADSDLRDAIKEAFTKEEEFMLSSDIDIDGVIEYTSNYEHEDGSRCSLSEDIQAGRILLLPNNLYIWATMNTSDQSLFPMDSAFKRRWSWEYVPISYKNAKSGEFTITIGEENYDWHDFLKAVNNEIKKVTASEDKQMGNFFIKKSIDEKEFCDKVMFYLWSEIGKDNYKTNDAIFKWRDENDNDTEFSFNELYPEGENRTKILKGFIKYIKEVNKQKNTVE